MSRLAVCLRRVRPERLLLFNELRASVRYTDSCYSQDAQGTHREHPQADSAQTTKDDGGKPGVRFLARSKRGTRFRTAPLLSGTKQRRRRFSRLRWGETKEGDAVGGARLTIEIGADFPIGIIASQLAD